MAKILVINGPNLNLLGSRETEIYGVETLADIESNICAIGAERGVDVEFVQSNHEGQLIEWVQNASNQGVEFILINPGAFTHTSIALRDAFSGVDIPFIEVHLSNVYAREEFRRQSYLSDIAVGVVTGFGATSYELALRAAISKLGASS